MIHTSQLADIAEYDRHSNKWSRVGQLLEPRTFCTAASLSKCSLLVCGEHGDTRDIDRNMHFALYKLLVFNEVHACIETLSLYIYIFIFSRICSLMFYVYHAKLY